MDTSAHLKTVNEIKYDNIGDNPYLSKNEEGVLYVDLFKIITGGLEVPKKRNLKLSAGEFAAIFADYVTKPDWLMQLHLHENLNLRDNFLFDAVGVSSLAPRLVAERIDREEENIYTEAFNELAEPEVTREFIDNIFAINNKTYVSFSSTLNFLIQQIVFWWYVPHYGDMLNRNQTHFTPWSTRVYVIGHYLALCKAKLAYEFKKYLEDKNYQSTNDDFIRMLAELKAKNTTDEQYKDIAYRLHALALGLEFATAHFYTDHFCSGHMSQVGIFRSLFPKLFGETLGGILVNSLHDELNKWGVNTSRIYSPSEDTNTLAFGDDSVENEDNKENLKACAAGLQASVLDIDNVLATGVIPNQNLFGGLAYLPDVDFKSRQAEPLFLLGPDAKIYYRANLNQINMLSPNKYAALRHNPLAHGYKELSSTWDAFWLVVRIRILGQKGELIQPTAVQLADIEADELLVKQYGLTPLAPRPGLSNELEDDDETPVFPQLFREGSKSPVPPPPSPTSSPEQTPRSTPTLNSVQSLGSY